MSKSLETRTGTLFQKTCAILLIPVTAALIYTGVSLDPSYKANRASRKQAEKVIGLYRNIKTQQDFQRAYTEKQKMDRINRRADELQEDLPWPFDKIYN